TMADVNVNTLADQAHIMAPPIRTDDQILPHIRWVPIGKISGLPMKHKFHPRPDSPLYLPNEEPVLGYLKFSAKGTKREVFGMPIPGNLITVDIQDTMADVNVNALADQAHIMAPPIRIDDQILPHIRWVPIGKIDIQGASYYQEYLAKAAKHQRYLVGKTGSEPDSPALKPTKTAKKSKLIAPKADPRPPILKMASSKQTGPKPQWLRLSSLRLIDESVAEVTEEQVARDLLTLQTPKKKSPADRYIFQRRTSAPTGSSGHDESSSVYAELGLMDSEEESDEDVPRTDGGVQSKGQVGPNPDAQDEGQAGLNPDEQVEGQGRPNPGDAKVSQPLPSPIVHAGSDLEHMDLDVVDVLTQPHPEQMDERFTAMAYPKVQENLKLMVEEHVMLEEPASSSRTLYSLQHLTKDLIFGDLFFSDKPSKADNEKQLQKSKLNQWCLS
nr:histone deacetylase 14 [Tanacetum cinerariifolium]